MLIEPPDDEEGIDDGALLPQLGLMLMNPRAADCEPGERAPLTTH